MKIKMEKVVVTGFSVISPLGNTIEQVWTSLCCFEDAVKEYDDLKEEGFRFTKACRVGYFENEMPGRRGYSMALQCIREALLHAQLNPPAEAGIFLGSTI